MKTTKRIITIDAYTDDDGKPVCEDGSKETQSNRPCGQPYSEMCNCSLCIAEREEAVKRVMGVIK